METKQTIREIIDKHSNVARFSKCLGISRPSLYKYIESYDNGDHSGIPQNILAVFNTLLSGNEDFRLIYFTDLYAKYLNENESSSEPVPKEIAAKIDSLELTLDDVDEWIEHTENMKNELEHEIESRNLNREIYKSDLLRMENRIKDLEYTRELVEHRMNERHFINVKEGKMEWVASTGPSHCFAEIYTEEIAKEDPDLQKALKCCKAKTEEGYMFYFAGASEDDCIQVHVKVSRGWNEGIDARIATFSPDKGQFYVKLPRIFDDAHEYAFYYEVERYRDGKLLNKLTGLFGR